MDNIFLIRDIIKACKYFNVNIRILSPDQEIAFDRVDHSYLFSVLRAFDLGERWVTLLYHGVQCLVNMGAGLSWPIPVHRGIRQGCSILGQLYSLAVEPLLCRLRS